MGGGCKMTFNEIHKSKEYDEDKNCCTVVASSLAFDVPFPEVQKFYAKNGRKKFKGLHPDKTDELILKMANTHKYNVFLVPHYKGMTVNNFDEYYPLGRFIIGMSRHVATCIDGGVEDWSEGTKKRITRVWQIVKI